jgi:hypothetical protein
MGGDSPIDTWQGKAAFALCVLFILSMAAASIKGILTVERQNREAESRNVGSHQQTGRDGR